MGSLSFQQYIAADGATALGDFEITVALHKHGRGQRIGREILAGVLQVLRGVPDVRRVISRVSPYNEASLHLMQALGFRHIGERRNLWSNRPDDVFALDNQ